MGAPSQSWLQSVFADIREYRRAYILTGIASFGGMLFGWGKAIPTDTKL